MDHSLDKAKRIVIKVGSALLVDQTSGALNQAWLAALLEDITRFYQRGQQIIIVSSGAVAMGRQHLGIARRALKLEEAQAAAAVGQLLVSQAYQEVFSKAGITVAQMLITIDDSENRSRYLNARNTLEKLLHYGVIPVINENDSVATSEIRYGDNDRLAARVAQMGMADVLVLLSDIDGLYSADPHLDPSAHFIHEVTAIDDKLRAIAGESVSDFGSGGMRTKLAAAEIVMSSGCKMLIADGKPHHPLKRLEEGGDATVFHAKTSSGSARKSWLKQHLHPKGWMLIDQGAINALKRGGSLLPAGVLSVGEHFTKGDLVRLIDEERNEVARGLANYNSHEAGLICGLHSSDIPSTLGYNGSEEMIHRNDLALC